MADWMKIEKATPDKPEIAILARKLGISQGDAFLEWFRVYCWADGICEYGSVPFLSLVDADTLSRATPGTCEALASDEINWLAVSDGELVFSNWDRHNGKSAKQRAKEAERKRKQRSKPSEKCPKNVRKKVGQKRQTSSLLFSYSELRSNEEKSDGPIVSESLRTDEFGAAWDRWATHREEIRKKLTPTSVGQQLKRFEKWGVRRAIVAIDHTVANGWQGIREPDEIDPQTKDRCPTEEDYANWTP